MVEVGWLGLVSGVPVDREGAGVADREGPLLDEARQTEPTCGQEVAFTKQH